MHPFEDIHVNTVKAEQMYRDTHKALKLACQKLVNLRTRAYVIAVNTTTEKEREDLTTLLIRDMLNIQLPPGISEQEVSNGRPN